MEEQGWPALVCYQQGRGRDRPGACQDERVASAVLIEQVLIDKKEITRRDTARLAPGKGEIEFHYTGLSLLAPQKVYFKYQLEGFDKEWVNAGTRRAAYYTNLPPGPYRFRVTACNNDGVWNESGVAFEFYLEPHFYQSTPFYVLCALTYFSQVQESTCSG